MQFSAKTKNEAITKACIELGVSSDQLDIQVISEGSSGFFGIGSKPALSKLVKYMIILKKKKSKIWLILLKLMLLKKIPSKRNTEICTEIRFQTERCETGD